MTFDIEKLRIGVIGLGYVGLPLAVQLVGPFGDEATLFRLGAQLEEARPWFGRKPELAE